MASREDLFGQIEPIVNKSGYFLEDVIIKSAGKNSIVQILLDKDSGINLDEVAEVSNKISIILDEKNLMGNKPYTLDVGSPGIDRPLTQLRHWHKNMGRLVKINFGSNEKIGRIEKVEENEITLNIKGKSQVFNLSQIDKAIIQIEFNQKS